ncbi:hypothetical protein GCM10023231_04940 [Olivibacter ginsenosidimutans]|uniref:Uncharacterized protein n=1 Tax=Olivibacter ginsenosidimutans TaxID=1176537 RepID=A0ABP9AJA4_9SPHI
MFAFDDQAKKDIEEKLHFEDIKFKNIEVLKGGTLFDLNNDWFKNLAIELDADQYTAKKNDITVNVSLPPQADKV